MDEIKIFPCPRHRSILSSDLPWERALQIADDCPDCTVTDKSLPPTTKETP